MPPAWLAPRLGIIYAVLPKAIDRLEKAYAQQRQARARILAPPRRRAPPAPHRPPPRAMTETRFWLIRHAIVEENARAMTWTSGRICPGAALARAW